MCPDCQSTETDWAEWSGRGKVYSWIVVHHPAHPALADQVPYVVALVELEARIRVVANVVGCPPDEVRADMPVELFFADVGDGERLPNFRAVTDP
jgi:uncharacterized OB-fold protein